MDPLYVRNSNEMCDVEEEDSVDIWDDSLLVKAYDRALSDAKDKITKKVNVSQKVHSNKTEKHLWKKGDYCRAVYTDGIEYEAVIVDVLKRNQCVIKYFGYGNEEIVSFKDLLESHGEEARIQQSRVVNSDEHSNDYDMEIAETMGLGIPGIPPPPPPHIMSDCNVNESEALSAMLMAWYMSGYHTGYYQGLMKSKKKNLN